MTITLTPDEARLLHAGELAKNDEQTFIGWINGLSEVDLPLYCQALSKLRGDLYDSPESMRVIAHQRTDSYNRSVDANHDTAWQAYEDAGKPNGDTQEGMMQWLLDQSAT